MGLAGAASVIFLSFLYGIFHAAGPGHGKMVTVTYLLTRRGRISGGLALAGGIAFVQAVSAILIVGGLSWVLGATSREVIGMATTVETGSYIIVVAVGLFMLVNILRGRDACGHNHEHDAGDHHHHHDHDHASGHGTASDNTASERGNIVGLSLASGLRPCTGAILVLLFTLANGVFLLGVVATLFMGLGVAITIALIGMGSIAAQRGLFCLLPQGGGARLSRYLGAAGALLVMLMGMALLLGVISGGAAVA
ncbi:MAG: ABC transporter [Rhodospirillales bacterium]